MKYKILYLPTGDIVNKPKEFDDNYPFNGSGYTLDYHIDNITEFDLIEVKKFFVVLGEFNTKARRTVFLSDHFELVEVKDV